MWNLSRLEIDGLMSFGQATIDFVDGEVIVVYGINRDASGAEKSNGSGKSALLEGIGFGITGSPLRKINKGELVNDDCKSATVAVELCNSGLDEVMRIERIVYPKKSSVCKVIVNGVQVEKLTSTDEANKYIETKLGIVRDDLLNFFILTAAKFTPFLDATDTKKKEVINRFSNGIIIDKSIEVMEGDMALANEELAEFQKDSDSLEQTLEALRSTLNETLKEKATNPDEEVSKINSMIGLLEKQICDKNDEIIDLKEDLEEVDDDLKDIPSSDDLHKKLISVEAKYKAERRRRNELKAEFQEVEHRIKHIKLKVEGSLDCPKCGHEFDPTDKEFDVEKAELLLDELGKKKEEILKEGKSVRENVDKLQAQVDSVNTKISKISGKKSALMEERSDIENDISKANNFIENNKGKIEAWELKIEAVKGTKSADAATPLKSKISSIEAKLKPISEKLGELVEENDDYKIQLDVFRRFKSHLANMSLKSMEGLVNDYLEGFGSDIFLQLNSDSMLASGKSKEKISATLIRNGIDIGSFNKRSGGEKAAINLAFAKTLSHLINLNAGDNKGVNLLIIDEILDSTDQSGMQKIVGAMERSGDNCIIITHIPLADSYGKSYTVVKEDDISRIL